MLRVNVSEAAPLSLYVQVAPMRMRSRGLAHASAKFVLPAGARVVAGSDAFASTVGALPILQASMESPRAPNASRCDIFLCFILFLLVHKIGTCQRAV